KASIAVKETSHFMPQQEQLQKTITFVKQQLQDAEGGHDWFHIQRVFNNSLLIVKNEAVDLFVVQLGALLHDIADSKFHNGDETVGPTMARNFLKSIDVAADVINHVVNIIENISFEGGNVAQKFNSLELQVVQDDNRFDVIGAIGIARTFNYSGLKNRTLYHPDIAPNMTMSKEEYKVSNAPT